MAAGLSISGELRWECERCGRALKASRVVKPLDDEGVMLGRYGATCAEVVARTRWTLGLLTYRAPGKRYTYQGLRFGSATP